MAGTVKPMSVIWYYMWQLWPGLQMWEPCCATDNSHNIAVWQRSDHCRTEAEFTKASPQNSKDSSNHFKPGDWLAGINLQPGLQALSILLEWSVEHSAQPGDEANHSLQVAGQSGCSSQKSRIVCSNTRLTGSKTCHSLEASTFGGRQSS